MDATQPVSPINLFQNGQITLGTASARLEKVIDPETEQLDVANVDQLVGGRPVVIPRRANGSDVEVAGQQGLAAQHTLADRAAHYAQHRGQVSLIGLLGGRTYTVAQVLGTTLVLEDKTGAQKVVDLTKGTKVKWGAVTPAFEERRTPSWRLNLRNVAGADALQVQGDVAATMAVRYTLVIDAAGAAFDQHAMGVKMTPMVEVTNGSGVDMKDMALAIKLNEPRNQIPPMARSASRGMPEAAGGMADVGGASEGQVSGVITMPIRAAGSFNLAKGQTEWVNFAGAAAGKPNDPMTSIPMKVDQTLGLDLAVFPNKKVGEAVERKSTPLATYKLAEASVARPAGTYEIFDEGDFVSSQQTYQYTKKGEAVQLAGGPFAALSGATKITTASFEEGEWKPVQGGSDKRVQYEEAVHTYRTQVELDVSSTSQVARDTDVTLNLSQFNGGVDDVKVYVGGRAVRGEVTNGVLTVRIPVGALKADVAGSGKLLVTFTGRARERRSI